jgi:hypothetical protein
MQRTAALSRIEYMRFNIRPKINKLTALVDPMRIFFADHSRGVEAASAASTHASRKLNEEEEKKTQGNRNEAHRRILYKVSILGGDSADQLNFELASNKNSMTVFMIRLRRVYRD